ncbi:similar to vacuolar protein sorting protein (Vps36) [Plenodomus lingam JN3]|uniref:Vacuolar protein-sorting-associated protein 36 n=1 Tax=Leptosphaeria maculans (strain JN3 / isolate v23.1.3 / race Av1-4-5-6-7-8) TaxID=985895 RepID=E4ZIF9_LEPMJ|nr:similar to vacuolar protein sorting protein (Vps36) [Plenodomus lingam JN3]CBX90980.1 similar to vacuolar protein sorting protein (Vps36) [Plenodomus lingam JN3]
MARCRMCVQDIGLGSGRNARNGPDTTTTDDDDDDEFTCTWSECSYTSLTSLPHCARRSCRRRRCCLSKTPLGCTRGMRMRLGLPIELLTEGSNHSKLKIPHYQNGQAYLTSHRVCYVDHNEPRKNSVAILLKDVEKPEFYAGFLKSSAKITLFPKPLKQLSRGVSTSPHGLSSTTPPRHSSPAPAPPPTSATWVCPICSFSNPVPVNFDPALASRTPIPPCLACGINPPTVHVVKAAIAAMSNRSAPGPLPKDHTNDAPASSNPGGATLSCPRCTFQNHPSLSHCEICGASLTTAIDKRLGLVQDPARPPSPGPVLTSPVQSETAQCIKLSFRGGGEKIFFERLKNALVQRKWLLQSAPPIPKPRPSSGFSDDRNSSRSGKTSVEVEQPRVVGIAGLERRGLEQRQNNEAMIGGAFEDLEALMTSAKEIIALAEQFASQANLGTNGNSEANALASQSASALGLVTTKDMLGSGSGSESLYISELSRNLAEWLTDDTRGVLKKEGGIMTLVDLWAVFNRARGGVELVSPADFEKAACMWDSLKLPVRLRKFKSGLLVVQGRDRTDEKTIASLLCWLKGFHEDLLNEDATWDWKSFGRGVTAQETAERFGWSVGVATEELEMAEEAGALCREQGIDGLRFWENWIINMPNTNPVSTFLV